MFLDVFGEAGWVKSTIILVDYLHKSEAVCARGTTSISTSEDIQAGVFGIAEPVNYNLNQFTCNADNCVRRQPVVSNVRSALNDVRKHRIEHTEQRGDPKVGAEKSASRPFLQPMLERTF